MNPLTPQLWPEWYCNLHGAPLIARRDQLVCPDGHSFQITMGIPRFVPSNGYADHFGAQWNRFRLTQLDSHTGHPISRNRIRRCVGERVWNNLHGKQVLECGCGAGRFTEILLAAGAEVTSIDLSTAVDANALNCPVAHNHRIAQADVLQLPFLPQQFDVVFCLGVVQHTPNPEETIAQLFRHVAPGGALVFDHYTYQIGWYTKTSPLFRVILKRLSPQRGLSATEGLVDLFLPLHKRATRINPVLHRIAQADILQLPFLPQQFDVVFCLGVIQHTPKPEETIAQLYRHVAPGGALVFDHYTYQIGWYTKTSPLLRVILKRLSPQRGMSATEGLVDLFLPLHKRATKMNRLLRRIAHHLSPIISYYSELPELDDDLQREWALLDTHDTLTDWFKHFRTRGQIQRVLEDLGAEDIWCEYGGNGVEARGRRPR